jgi:hypothetical protein
MDRGQSGRQRRSTDPFRWPGHRVLTWHNCDVSALRTVRVIRYVTPLREGGSLPAVVEADDDGTYVVKFRGAGQGPKALIAELVAGEVARALDLPMPELVFADLHEDLARTEPDPEIFSLIRSSAGLNLAIDYLPGSLTFDPLVQKISADLASRIVWFDAYVTNVDRTARNTNLLMWHRRLWLIDHGASLYAQHSPGWAADRERPRDPFPKIREHVLLRYATMLEAIDADMAGRLTPDVIKGIVDLIPDAWLEPDAWRVEAAHTEVRLREDTSARQDYGRYLTERLAAPRTFVEEAARAR